ncbi:MAG: hypothetical protein Fur005_21260 [Roseiflexaceae bacterium]
MLPNIPYFTFAAPRGRRQGLPCPLRLRSGQALHHGQGLQPWTRKGWWWPIHGSWLMPPHPDR